MGKISEEWIKNTFTCDQSLLLTTERSLLKTIDRLEKQIEDLKNENEKLNQMLELLGGNA